MTSDAARCLPLPAIRRLHGTPCATHARRSRARHDKTCSLATHTPSAAYCLPGCPGTHISRHHPLVARAHRPGPPFAPTSRLLRAALPRTARAARAVHHRSSPAGSLSSHSRPQSAAVARGVRPRTAAGLRERRMQLPRKHFRPCRQALRIVALALAARACVISCGACSTWSFVRLSSPCVPTALCVPRRALHPPPLRVRRAPLLRSRPEVCAQRAEATRAIAASCALSLQELRGRHRCAVLRGPAWGACARHCAPWLCTFEHA